MLSYNNSPCNSFLGQARVNERVGALLQRQTLSKQVIDHALRLIQSGQIKPGEKLPTEQQLTASLGVSRTCVREAMKALESLGLIRVGPRVGAVVLEPSPVSLLMAQQLSAEVDSKGPDVLLEFRMIVEVGLASLAAERATASDLAAMRRALDLYREELEQKRSIDCHTDMSFHAALAAASKNPLGQAVWRMISARLGSVLEKNAAVPNVYPNTLRDHEAIFAAIQARDPASARKAMRKHLENADRVERIAAYAGKSGKTPAVTDIGQARRSVGGRSKSAR
jgi:GntR family transcriptional repressor for pyruvate dehydrogenase complex